MQKTSSNGLKSPITQLLITLTLLSDHFYGFLNLFNKILYFFSH